MNVSNRYYFYSYQWLKTDAVGSWAGSGNGASKNIHPMQIIMDWNKEKHRGQDKVLMYFKEISWEEYDTFCRLYSEESQ